MEQLNQRRDLCRENFSFNRSIGVCRGGKFSRSVAGNPISRFISEAAATKRTATGKLDGCFASSRFADLKGLVVISAEADTQTDELDREWKIAASVFARNLPLPASPPSLIARYSSGHDSGISHLLRPPAQIASLFVLRIQMFGRLKKRNRPRFFARQTRG